MGNLCAKTKSSSDVEIQKAEAVKRAQSQRRRLSVKPDMVGDVNAAAETPMPGDGPDQKLTKDQLDAKGDCETCLISHKGYVPYNSTKRNQDRGIIRWTLKGDQDIALFGCFDGHGEFGHDVSQFVIDHLPKSLELQDNLKENPIEAIKAAVEHTHTQLKQSSIDIEYSGTTATFSIKIGNKLYTANAGDSRTVLCTRQGDKFVAVPLSEDNKPEQPEEKKRILASGGRVDPLPGDPEEDLGPMRVWRADAEVPGLAMSRSIGDAVAAQVGVTSEPVITEHTIVDEDVFVIWASDGVWEFLSNQEAIDIVLEHSAKGDLVKGTEAVCKVSKQRWQAEEDVIDDITAVVLQFQKK